MSKSLPAPNAKAGIIVLGRLHAWLVHLIYNANTFLIWLKELPFSLYARDEGQFCRSYTHFQAPLTSTRYCYRNSIPMHIFIPSMSQWAVEKPYTLGYTSDSVSVVGPSSPLAHDLRPISMMPTACVLCITSTLRIPAGKGCTCAV